ncbi:MAG TPA: YncE family protein [Pseudonocardiaceae bacterium]
MGRNTRHPHVIRLVPAVLFLALAGCGSAAPPAPPPLPPPADPATAPALTATPAGRLVAVGSQPEGVVADPVTHLVAVGVRQPNTLVLLDGRTGQVTARVPLPGHLRHLQLAKPGGPVLVPDENSDALLTVTLPAGTLASRVHTGVSPHDATEAGNGLMFAANEGGASVAVIRGDTVVHTFTDVVQPAGLAPVGTLVGLVDVRQNTLHVYDAAALKPLAQLPAGAGPTHGVADSRGHLAVIDTRGNAVLFYQLTPTIQQIGRLALPGTPYGVTYDRVRDRLWVTLTARNELAGIDLAGSTPQVVARIPTVRQPNTVAVDDSTGRLFVTGTDAGVLELIDP